MFSADRGHTLALQSGRRASDDARPASQPLALPALAAALHVVSHAAQGARAKLAAARNSRPFIHEDQPAD